METVVRIRSPTSWDYVSHLSPELSSFHFPTLKLLSHLSYRWASLASLLPFLMLMFLFIYYIYQPHPELLLSAQAISSQDISVTPYITQVIFYQSGLGTSGDLSVGQGLLVFVEIIFWSQFMRVWVSDHKISGSYLYGVCVCFGTTVRFSGWCYGIWNTEQNSRSLSVSCS